MLGSLPILGIFVLEPTDLWQVDSSRYTLGSVRTEVATCWRLLLEETELPL